jgi:hypothetical protein
MTQHTQGPWQLDKHVNGEVFIYPKNGRHPICKVNKDYEANARLIAAAPELLEALTSGEDIISGLEAECDNLGVDLSEVRQWWIKAESIIAKATGGAK